MPINITDELHAATTKGKIASAKEVFLTGDTENLQQIGEKTHQLEDSIKNIAGDKIRNGSLDSIAKINALDEILGTELKLMIE